MPPLTRYKEATFPVIKKRLAECAVLDNEVNKKLHELTTAKLCIRLNTLQVSPLFFRLSQVDFLSVECRFAYTTRDRNPQLRGSLGYWKIAC